MRQLNLLDRVIEQAGDAVEVIAGRPHAQRSTPVADLQHGSEAMQQASLTDAERQLSGALMRVNHVGEVCAQALYQGQALAARDEATRRMLLDAAQEETDHLAWTRERLDALGARPSLLNPVWYAGAFAIGFAAAKLSDRASLGFVVETERQVEAHLQGHLNRLPEGDAASRAIVAQMKVDEAAHADAALAQGALELPAPVKAAMRLAAKVMTTTAHYI
jgi:ubiquinone biosynthesis monooxygenase Coq7